MPKKFTFENAIDDLQTIVSKMESGDLSLEASLAEYEKGIKLTRQCQEALKKAEQKIQLLSPETGEIEPFISEEAKS